MRNQPNGGRLSVGSGHSDDRNRRPQSWWRRPGLDRGDAARGLVHRASDRPAPIQAELQQWGQFPAKRFRRPLPPPGKSDHDFVGIRPQPATDGQVGLRRVSELPREVDRQPGDEAAALIAQRCTRAGHRRDPHPQGPSLRAFIGQDEPGTHAERQLDRGTREIQIRSVEHSELAHGHTVNFAHGKARVQSGRRGRWLAQVFCGFGLARLRHRLVQTREQDAVVGDQLPGAIAHLPIVRDRWPALRAVIQEGL